MTDCNEVTLFRAPNLTKFRQMNFGCCNAEGGQNRHGRL